ncbi:lytic transglycosylase domain-containing protein [Larkinella terrae]|uniref:Transglycosylase SLT domain-containing protein n=1 Tax=Larkinella terrae TaxID=2025311 RepID=A0A7K0ESN1_9BACT|nr:lytic transglycosylase domain-containing protein [Larkinella terrae]MRS64823.1 transglycosylase SLT domain-containing protein [Larkinella terrae]
MIKEASIFLILSTLKPIGLATAKDVKSREFTSYSNGTVSVMLPGTATIQSLQPVQFCGEFVPLRQSNVTRRWVTVLLQQSRHRDYLLRLRKRAVKFFPVIEPVLASYNIPRDFKYLPLVESDLSGTSTSPKGAGGYWQLMPQTARDFGLVVRPGNDERRDLYKSTVAACRYLQELHRELGSWTLVAAAYNSGVTHVQNRIDQQGIRSYYNLRLHRETSTYLYRVLAYKELLTRPRMYSDMLSPAVLADLTRPLPGERFQPGVLPFTHSTGEPGVEPEPTWGPRSRNFLEETLAQIVGDTDENSGASDAGSASMTSSPGQTPAAMAGLVGLRVLRFRRTRLWQVFLAAKRKIQPLFDWDWV